MPLWKPAAANAVPPLLRPPEPSSPRLLPAGWSAQAPHDASHPPCSSQTGKAATKKPPPPITLTDAALAHLCKMRAESGGEELLLRLGVKSGGCSGMSYVMDFESPENIKKDGESRAKG